MYQIFLVVKTIRVFPDAGCKPDALDSGIPLNLCRKLRHTNLDEFMLRKSKISSGRKSPASRGIIDAEEIQEKASPNYT